MTHFISRLNYIKIITSILVFLNFLWLLFDPRFEALAALIANIILILSIIYSDFSTHQPASISRFNQSKDIISKNYRQELLDKIQSMWLEEEFEKSLNNAKPIKLHFKVRYYQYKYSGSKKNLSYVNDNFSSVISLENSVTNVVNDILDSTVIIGDPGSGKSTLLLFILKELTKRARKNGSDPIPLMFNASSWNQYTQIDKWIAEELHSFYSIPRNTSQTLINSESICLLIDGLDEVRNLHSCLDALNQFNLQYKSIKVIISVRTNTYVEIPLNLRFWSVELALQPLTLKQINDYLDQWNNDMDKLREALQVNSSLISSIRTPLSLSMLVKLTKQGKLEEAISYLKEENATHKLLDFYLDSTLR